MPIKHCLRILLQKTVQLITSIFTEKFGDYITEKKPRVFWLHWNFEQDWRCFKVLEKAKGCYYVLWKELENLRVPSGIGKSVLRSYSQQYRKLVFKHSRLSKKRWILEQKHFNILKRRYKEQFWVCFSYIQLSHYLWKTK